MDRDSAARGVPVPSRTTSTKGRLYVPVVVPSPDDRYPSRDLVAFFFTTSPRFDV